ncbi:MAG: flagellar hook-associated protein FlgK, partial [Burkholderiales bacterium]|nr:flagellar hook-associated protein FlgK [Burkholderiales bacterium]
GATNTGSGAIDAGSVDTSYPAAPLSSPVTLTYNSGPPSTLSFAPAGAAVTSTVNGTATTYAAGTPVPYTPGTPTQLSFGGITVNLSGAPANGDTFTISPNASGVSDSRNGQLLSALQTANTMAGGTASFTDVYAKLVSDIGSTTAQYQTTSTAQSNLLKQATNAQSSVSGVNMDEEAANLLSYQQMYQANSKVIQIASTLFDTILNLNP